MKMFSSGVHYSLLSQNSNTFTQSQENAIASGFGVSDGDEPPYTHSRLYEQTSVICDREMTRSKHADVDFA